MKEHFFDRDSSSHFINLMGGKATNLYIMTKEGISIPKWFCLSSEIYNQYYQTISTEVNELLNSIIQDDLENIKECSRQIGVLFENLELESELEVKILSRLEDGKRYAVRSSALGEDGAENSYAGQLSSFLYIEKKEIIQSVKRCWASLFSPQSIQYRIHNKIDKRKTAVSVIIQDMIDASKSGVLFTANPLLRENFLDEIVITAAYGVGEGVVNDKADTDYYVFSKKQKQVIDSVYVDKLKQVVMDPSGGTNVTDVEASKQKVSVLTHNEVRKLAAVAMQIRDLYRKEQDIEWCFDHTGTLYITQSRAVTTIDKGVDALDFYLDNSNVVESFPGVNTPWTLGQVRDIYSITFKKACLRLGINRNKVNLNHYTFQNLIGMYQGRIFYNLTNWYRMMRMVPYTNSYIKVWEEMLGVSKNLYSNSKELGFFHGLSEFKDFIVVLYRLGYHFVTLDFHLKRLDLKMRKLFDEYWEEEAKGNHLEYTPARAVDRLEQFKAQLFVDADLTLINDIYAFIFAGLTKKIIAKYTVLDGDQTFNELLYGISGMDSIKPLESIIKLAALVHSNEALKKELLYCVEHEYFDLLLFRQNKEYLEFSKAFDAHIEEFGDRGTNELKLETLTFREDQLALIKLILDYTQIDTSHMFADFSKREQTEQKVVRELGAKKHIVFAYKFFLKMAIRSINYRENFRLHRSRAYGIVRRMSNNLGKKLKAIGDLNHYRDIYFLEKADVYNQYSGQKFNYDLKSIVRRNRELFSNYEEQQTSPQYTIRQGVFQEVLASEEDATEVLTGTPCSSGEIQGEAYVIHDIAQVNKQTNLGHQKILVAPMTDPGWVFLMAASKGLIVEKGSVLSHTAIIGRELGIPTVVGVKGATHLIQTGDLIQLNANRGEVKIIKKKGGNA